MNFAIEHKRLNSPFLQVTGRRNSLKHKLIYVESGLMLVRLGKLEYAIEPGQLFWLPFDCLCATTQLPNSVVHEVSISVRIKAKFAKQAGYVADTPLLLSLIEKLSLPSINQDYTEALLKVVKYECITLKPQLTLSPLSERISQWAPHKPLGEKEIHLGLLVREARKMKLSGRKDDDIATKLFAGRVEQFHALYHALVAQD
ncbi:AraC family transcriptional regulator [Vibrio sp. WXL210]|uniref:AraC family transcriptional regulator n=1 Tax=Vibrio sp. WXL210 TaxID=3450709 RepID=UPI003EC4AE31